MWRVITSAGQSVTFKTKSKADNHAALDSRTYLVDTANKTIICVAWVNRDQVIRYCTNLTMTISQWLNFNDM